MKEAKTKKFGKNIGKYEYKIAWKKAAYKHVARRLYQKKQYGNIKIMVKSVRKYIKKHNNKKSKWYKQVMSPDEQEDQEELIKKYN